jgi:hypothetical protein
MCALLRMMYSAIVKKKLQQTKLKVSKEEDECKQA